MEIYNEKVSIKIVYPTGEVVHLLKDKIYRLATKGNIVSILQAPADELDFKFRKESTFPIAYNEVTKPIFSSPAELEDFLLFAIQEGLQATPLYPLVYNKETYEYDSNGNVIKITFLFDDVPKFEHMLTYDANNNPISRTINIL